MSRESARGGSTGNREAARRPPCRRSCKYLQMPCKRAGPRRTRWRRQRRSLGREAGRRGNSLLFRPTHTRVLADRVTVSPMPAPMSERQALERERAELPAHVAAYRREPDATLQGSRGRREGLGWRIRRVESRMAEFRARLTALVLIAVTTLAGCGGGPVSPTYTQEDLKAECDRRRGYWRPGDLRGGYCDFRGP
jgi:hypothetical protein